jgi:hypothetical protein
MSKVTVDRFAPSEFQHGQIGAITGSLPTGISSTWIKISPRKLIFRRDLGGGEDHLIGFIEETNSLIVLT